MTTLIVNDFTIEEDDHVFMTIVHLVKFHHCVCALSTGSRHPAEAFAKNSKLKGFHDINVFSKTAFDSLPGFHKWDHAIELEHKPSPGFYKVYLMTLTEQTGMDTFL
jgi:hypothetical protein